MLYRRQLVQVLKRAHQRAETSSLEEVQVRAKQDKWIVIHKIISDIVPDHIWVILNKIYITVNPNFYLKMETNLPAPMEKIETAQDLVAIGSPKLNNNAMESNI